MIWKLHIIIKASFAKEIGFHKPASEIYESIAEKINSNDLEGLERDLKIRRKYYEDLIPELEGVI